MTKFNLQENIKSFVSVSIAKDKKIVSIIDALVDNGEKACNYKKATAISEEMYNERKTAIPLGFSAYVQRLLNSDTKELSDIEKSDKRYWQQQIGAKMNLYLNVSGYGILDNLPQDKSPLFKNHPTIAVVTIIPPNHNHKWYHFRCLFDEINVPKVWILSFATTAYADIKNPINKISSN